MAGSSGRRQINQNTQESIRLKKRYDRLFAGETVLIDDAFAEKYPEFSEYNGQEYTHKAYTANDLTQDEYFNSILPFMQLRYGEHINEEDFTREEIVDTYLKGRRGFYAGNSVRAGSEVVWLNRLNEEDLPVAADGYKIYDRMQGAFSEANSAGETGRAVWQTTGSIIKDPVNVIGLGIGKIFSQGGAKAATTLAKQQAYAAFRRKLTEGATREVAEAAGNKIFQSTMQQLGTETIQRAGQSMTTNQIVKGVAATTAFDSSVAAGVDVAYQYGMVKTGTQEEYSSLQTGLAALGGLVLGGVQLGSYKLNNISGNQIDTSSWVPNKESVNNSVKNLTGALAEIGESGNWKKDILDGRELTDLDQKFWTTLLLGDDEQNIKGIAHFLRDEGLVFNKRNADDNVFNWIGDLLAESDEEAARGFISMFEDTFGIKMKDLVPEGEGIVSKPQDFMKEFSNILKRKVRDAAVLMNAGSQISKATGRSLDEIDLVEDTVGYLFNSNVVPEAQPLFSKSRGMVSEFAHDKLPKITELTENFQNNTIRMIVANVATTQLNIMGWMTATALNTASDIAVAAMHGGASTAKFLLGRSGEAAEQLRVASSIAKSQRQKLLNLVDPNTTFDTFNALVAKNPEMFRDLVHVLPGGVEDLSKVARANAPDYRTGVTASIDRGMEGFVDTVQSLQFVKAQDVWTKSQEYMHQMDKHLRISMDRSMQDIMQDPKFNAIVASKEYQKVHAKATYETMRSIFSQSFKSNTGLGKLAGIIEDFRNIPGLGILVPFGRFFNNTVAFVGDATGIMPLIFNTSKGPKQRSFQESLARFAVTSSAIATLIPQEVENVERGLGPFQKMDDTGQIIDQRFQFPHSALKAAAHYVAHKRVNEGELPAELANQMMESVMGQLTRQLDESEQGIYDYFESLLASDTQDSNKLWMDMFGKVTSQFGSAWTRFLQPANDMLGAARGEDFMVNDRKQGTRWLNETLRYTDQFTASMGITDETQRFDAARGEPMGNVTKYIGPRTEGPLSNTERLMNSIGRPIWKLNEFRGSPEANNRYNQLFNALVEEKAGEVYNHPKFKEWNLEQKQHRVDTMVKDVRKSVMRFMETNVSNSNDVELKLTFDIMSRGQKNVERAIKDLFDEEEDVNKVEDMTYEQLKLLETYLDYRDEYLEQSTR